MLILTHHCICSRSLTSTAIQERNAFCSISMFIIKCHTGAVIKENFHKDKHVELKGMTPYPIF